MLIFSFALFIIILIGFGYYSKRWVASGSDFVVAGRGIGFWLSFFGVVAIGVAGTICALATGYAVSFGFLGSQIPVLAWLLVGVLLFAVFFGKIARRSGTQTLPEYMEMRFDTRTRVIAAIITILGLLSITAVNIVGMVNIFVGFTGWNYDLTLFVIFACFVIFVFLGGLWAVTTTDFLQMVIALFFIPALFIWVFFHYGGIEFITANWPGPGSPWISGITGASMPGLSPIFPSTLTWTLQFGLMTFGASYYWMRMASARTEKIAVSSFLCGILPLILIVFPILGLLGLFSATANPGLFAPIGKLPAAAALGVILKTAPEFLGAGALIAIVAAAISTGATSYIGAVGTGLRDLALRFYKSDATSKEQLKISRWLTILAGAIIYAFCYFPGGFYGIVGASFVWLLPLGVLLWFGAYWPRTTSKAAFWGLLIGASTMLVLVILKIWGVYDVFKIAHLSVIGFVLCCLIYVIGSLVTKPKYYGETDFSAETDVTEISLSAKDKVVLKNIKDGFVNMVELCDLNGGDSYKINVIIEKLERNGLIKRKSYRGANFFTFEITSKGLEFLPKSTEIESKLKKYGLSFESLKFLKEVKQNPNNLKDYVNKSGLAPMAIVSFIRQTSDNGYIKEYGFWQRQIKLTDKGEELLKKNEIELISSTND